MVRGLLEVEHTDQVCGACLGGKHRRTSFPCQAEYRVEGPGVGTQRSLCGPISLETLSGSRYFLLLVDENNRFMWLRTLRSKDQVGVAIALPTCRKNRDGVPSQGIPYKPWQRVHINC
jgi:hypothetical protein